MTLSTRARPRRPSSPREGRRGRARRLTRRRTVALFLVLVVSAVLLLRANVAVPVRVESASMLPTYGAGDVVLVSRSQPDVADLRRGDLVTFRSPDDGSRALKRVLGLPGEALVILDGRLLVDGVAVPEPYVDHAGIDGYYSRTYRVPAGTVFVLGDNRGNSVDSRDYGPVAADDLLGRVLLGLWSVTG